MNGECTAITYGRQSDIRSLHGSLLPYQQVAGMIELPKDTVAAHEECNPCIQLHASMVVWFGDFVVADDTRQTKEVNYEGRHATGRKFLLSAQHVLSRGSVYHGSHVAHKSQAHVLAWVTRKDIIS